MLHWFDRGQAWSRLNAIDSGRCWLIILASPFMITSWSGQSVSQKIRRQFLSFLGSTSNQLLGVYCIIYTCSCTSILLYSTINCSPHQNCSCHCKSIVDSRLFVFWSTHCTTKHFRALAGHNTMSRHTSYTCDTSDSMVYCIQHILCWRPFALPRPQPES